MMSQSHLGTVGVNTCQLQVLPGLMKHKVQMLHMDPEHWVRREGHGFPHGVVPREVGEAASPECGDVLSTHPSKSLLKGVSKTVHPAVCLEGEKDPLRDGRLRASLQVSGDHPLLFPSGGVVDPDSVELGRWAFKLLGHQVQVTLKHQTSSVFQIVGLRLDVRLHLKVKWISKLKM